MSFTIYVCFMLLACLFVVPVVSVVLVVAVVWLFLCCCGRCLYYSQLCCDYHYYNLVMAVGIFR